MLVVQDKETMLKFAGSAIRQGPNVGRIDLWSEWSPIDADRESRWLLLSGASNPPKRIAISRRRPRDGPETKNGAFLAGVTRDLVNMEDVVGAKLFNTVKNLRLTKSEALENIKILLDACKRNGDHPMLYYTGHGEKGEGGDLTLFMTGKKKIKQLSTEPIYSGGNRDDFPTFYNMGYNAFITGHIKGNGRILISQSIHNGYFSGCFATSKLYIPRPAVRWKAIAHSESFIAFCEKQKPQNIYSLACDKTFGFAAFLMKGFGKSQSIVMQTADIMKKWNVGFKITACAAQDSTFYIIMTKDTKEYTGKTQKWFTRRDWSELNAKIEHERNNGKAVTGICYSTGQKLYFVVMTEMKAVQRSWWMHKDKKARIRDNESVEKMYSEGLHPTIFFHDPSDDKILILMTADENRSDYEFCLWNKMKNAKQNASKKKWVSPKSKIQS